MQFSIYQESRRGARRSNQDRIAYCYSKHALLMLVADGMGGHLNGELAAEIAAVAGAAAMPAACPIIAHVVLTRADGSQTDLVKLEPTTLKNFDPITIYGGGTQTRSPTHCRRAASSSSQAAPTRTCC